MNAYTPVATMMLTSAASDTSRIRGMYRPSPGAVGSTIVRIPASRTRVSFVHRVDDALLLVPVARTERVTPVLQRLGLHDEHVLVHERTAEVIQLHRASHGLDTCHGPLLSDGVAVA